MRLLGKHIFCRLKKHERKLFKIKDLDINNHHYYAHVV